MKAKPAAHVATVELPLLEGADDRADTYTLDLPHPLDDKWLGFRRKGHRPPRIVDGHVAVSVSTLIARVWLTPLSRIRLRRQFDT